MKAHATPTSVEDVAGSPLPDEGDHVRPLLESTNAIPWEADARTWQFRYVGPQAQKLLGYPVRRWYESGFWARQIHPDDRDRALETCRASSRLCSDYEFEYRMITAEQDVVWVHDIVSVVSDDGEPQTLRGFMIDITQRKRVERTLWGRNRVLERLAAGASLDEILHLLVAVAEDVNPKLLCSVLLLDEQEKCLRHGAAGRLPQFYNQAVDGVKIGPNVGSCGTAADLGQQPESFGTPPPFEFSLFCRLFRIIKCIRISGLLH